MDNPSQIMNALCVDLDDLAAALHEAGFSGGESEYLAYQETTDLLVELEALRLKATFFVPGSIVRRSPELVKHVATARHHIASHGSLHCKVGSFSRRAFMEDVLTSKTTLEDLIGLPVDTYKAPIWSITPSCSWAYDVLIEAGFRVDNSAMPGLKSFLGQEPGRITPFTYKDQLVVIPPTTVHIAGVTVRFCGGFYTAYVPLSLQRIAFASINRNGHPFNYYFHPFEHSPAPGNRRFIKHRSLYGSLYAAHSGVFKRHLRELSRHFYFGTLPEAYALALRELS